MMTGVVSRAETDPDLGNHLFCHLSHLSLAIEMAMADTVCMVDLSLSATSPAFMWSTWSNVTVPTSSLLFWFVPTCVLLEHPCLCTLTDSNEEYHTALGWPCLALFLVAGVVLSTTIQYPHWSWQSGYFLADSLVTANFSACLPASANRSSCNSVSATPDDQPVQGEVHVNLAGWARHGKVANPRSSFYLSYECEDRLAKVLFHLQECHHRGHAIPLSHH